MLRTLLLSLTLLSASVFAGPKVAVETNLGDFTLELNRKLGSHHGRQLSDLRGRWQLRRQSISPRDPRLYGPRRRL